MIRQTVFILVASLTASACSGTRPTDLGQTKTTLSACPNKPNCVISIERLTQPQHDQKIEPIELYHSNHLSLLKQIIVDDTGATLIVDSPNYLYAEYKSKWLGFVDDVELLIDRSEGQSKPTVHVRSASRVGHSDLGVNRKRVESIRAQYQSMQKH